MILSPPPPPPLPQLNELLAVFVRSLSLERAGVALPITAHREHSARALCVPERDMQSPECNYVCEAATNVFHSEHVRAPKFTDLDYRHPSRNMWKCVKWSKSCLMRKVIWFRSCSFERQNSTGNPNEKNVEFSVLRTCLKARVACPCKAHLLQSFLPTGADLSG